MIPSARRSIASLVFLTLSAITAPAQESPALRGMDSSRAPEPPTPEAVRAARDKLPRYMQALAATIPERAQRALARMPSFERRLLALRGYVRRLDRIESGWTWSSDETRAFTKTAEYRDLVEAIAEVRRRFRENNPGYHLRVTLGVRTFSEQLRSWNRVRSVRIAGAEVVDTSLIILADSLYSPLPDSASLARFHSFYRTYELINTPTVAVPGLSEHGQLRAFDFRIYRGARLIAGTSTASAARLWDSAGWTCRLAEAVCGVSDRFLGPLIEPYEPWHYRWVEPY